MGVKAEIQSRQTGLPTAVVSLLLLFAFCLFICLVGYIDGSLTAKHRLAQKRTDRKQPGQGRDGRDGDGDRDGPAELGFERYMQHAYLVGLGRAGLFLVCGVSEAEETEGQLKKKSRKAMIYSSYGWELRNPWLYMLVFVWPRGHVIHQISVSVDCRHNCLSQGIKRRPGFWSCETDLLHR